jgi:hypothetical protein
VVTAAATLKRLAAPERRIGWPARPHAWLEWSTPAELFELARLGCAHMAKLLPFRGSAQEGRKPTWT